MGDERGASSVIGVILLVGIVVVLVGAITPFVMNLANETQAKAPTVSVEHEIRNSTGGTDYDTSTDGDNLIAVTLDSGGPLQVDQLYVTSSKPIDIGAVNAADSEKNANDDYATDDDSPNRELFSEGERQIGIGDSWEAGETIYLAPDGGATDTEVSIYWTSKSVKAQDTGEVSPGDSYEIASFTT